MATQRPRGTYVPEKDRDTRYYIFTHLWRCRVPFLSMMSADRLKNEGMPTSGDAIYDREVAKEVNDRMLTINDMMDANNRGVRVQIVNHADSEKIYSRIQQHLKAWEEAIMTNYHINPPTDELIALDRFAKVVFSEAVHYFVDKPLDLGLARDLHGVLRFNRDNVFRKKAVTVSTINPITKEEEESAGTGLPERESLEDMFNRNRNNRR
jgi:hypothetical protein